MYSQEDKYPPKNRKKKSLPILEIRVISKDDSFITDPNGVVIAAATGEYPMTDPAPRVFSELSGKPAYILMTADVELKLSFDELDRFFRHDLKDYEFKYLLNRYGVFHEIHDDFYSEKTGKALQPIEIAEPTKERIAKEEAMYAAKVTSLTSKRKTTKKV